MNLWEVMELVLIAAVADNGVIGKDNSLIWHLPNDLKRFKRLTSGHLMIMGRKTFESIGKPLPYRENIVITRNPHYAALGIRTAVSLQEAIALVRRQTEKVFIIGGGEVYVQALDMVNTLKITRVHHYFLGDVKFPEIIPEQWEKSFEVFHTKDKFHPYDYSFITYKRKRSAHE
ncbi:MAG: dihydrofolate reductase [Flavobacteriales bacterium AspAUS03]